MARPEPQPTQQPASPSSSTDKHVGSRIRLRRTLLGMSEKRLGEALGLTFQQIQKYERGVNRVGASMLFDISKVLDVPISFFFDGLTQPPETTRPLMAGFAEAQSGFGYDDLLNRRETLELVRDYYRITDPAVRTRVIELIRSMSGFAEAVDPFVGRPDAVPQAADIPPGRPTATTEEAGLAEALAEARTRGGLLKQHLLTQPDMLSASQFASVLGTTAQEIRLKQQRHEILGIELDRRAIRYPGWQVLPNRRLLPGLPRLFAILGDDPWRMLRFLLQHHGETGGLRAVDALWRGDVAGVLTAAENMSVGAYS